MKEVIHLLVRRGFAITETDSNGYNPLMIALRDADCEPYIIKELISAGASLNRLTLDDASNTSYHCNKYCRHLNIQCLKPSLCCTSRR